MFTVIDNPTGHFTLLPFPSSLFFEPPPFGAGAMLVLNEFRLNSSKLNAEHVRGMTILAGQAQATWGGVELAVGEFFGVTDRSGSDSFNQKLSTQRAKSARDALWGVLGLGDANLTFSVGLGEQFAAEYYQEADNTQHGGFRGVACYLWESLSTARDPGLRIEIASASPPEGGFGNRRIFLPPLHLGRKANGSPFA